MWGLDICFFRSAVYYTERRYVIISRNLSRSRNIFTITIVIKLLFM